jgi:peroxiredoxin
MKQAITLLTLIGLTSVAFGAAEIGKPAPEFEAKDITGKTVKLSDYKGKVVVLESYNLDCPFCANHFKTGAMQELQKELTEKGAVWLLVNSVNAKHPNYRTPEQAKSEWEKQKMNATAWLDDSAGTIGKAYGMKTTPQIIVIDKSGNVAYNGAIDDKATPDHDPRKARNYAREAVGKVMAGEKVELAETKPYGCSVKYAN